MRRSGAVTAPAKASPAGPGGPPPTVSTRSYAATAAIAAAVSPSVTERVRRPAGDPPAADMLYAPQRWRTGALTQRAIPPPPSPLPDPAVAGATDAAARAGADCMRWMAVLMLGSDFGSGIPAAPPARGRAALPRERLAARAAALSPRAATAAS